MRAAGVGIAVALGSLGPVACLSDDLAHCANREGNATCAELGGGAYCSICVSDDYGCVAERPNDSCYRPGSSAPTTEGTSDTDEPSSSSASTMTEDPSTGTVECAQSGPDAACPASRPYCVDGLCISCGEAGSDYCASADPDLAQCHPSGGSCLACVDDGDCGLEVCSDTYACVECVRHEDCPDSACDLRDNTCLMPEIVMWVDPVRCDPPGFGTQKEPYCTIEDALLNISPNDRAIIHLSSTIPITEPVPFDVTGATLALLGEGNPTLEITETAIAASVDSTLFVDGVRIVGATIAARCDGLSELWLTNVELASNTSGVVGDTCARLVLDRALVIDTVDDAVSASESDVRIHASAFVDNGSGGAATSAVRAIESTVDIRYSTFAANRGTTGASIFCSGSNGEIRNSVMVSNDAPSVSCGGIPAQTSVVDGEIPGENLQIVDGFDSMWFQDLETGDVSVRTPDASPFRDVAVWGEGDPLRDISGTRRLAYPGLAEFAGAAQP